MKDRDKCEKLRKELSEVYAKLGELHYELYHAERNASSFETQRNESRFGAGQYSAMLADVCEVLFGDNATGSPHFLCYVHGSWACSFVSRKTSWLAQWSTKHEAIKLEHVEEWEAFLARLKLEETT